MKNFIREKLSKYISYLLRLNQSFKVQKFIDDGYLSVGNHTYGANNLNIQAYQGSESRIIIGKFCSIGPDVRVITGGIHPVNWISTYPFRVKWNLPGKLEDGMPYTNGDVVIGNDVWIGTGVTILSGITISHGAVIAAGSMVTKDVPPYAIMGGNPAKIIRYRFNIAEIEELIEMEWWDWSKEKISENIEILSSTDLTEFLNRNNE